VVHHFIHPGNKGKDKEGVGVRKLIVVAMSAVLFGCTIIRVEPDGSFYWMSTKKVNLTVGDLTLSTDPDSQYLLAQKIVELAK
jgi:hypothetical protein